MKKNNFLNLSLHFLIIVFLLINILIHVPFTHAKGSCSCADNRESIVENEEGCKTFCGAQGRAYQEIKEGEKGGVPAPINLTNPIAATNVPQLIGSIIQAVLGIVGALALLMFVYGGFMWLTSGGSPDKIKKGKDILIWAVIGLAVIFASYALVDFVIRALGG
jgi:hypothetical protein